MADQPKIIISAVDNTKAAFSSVKSGLGQIEGVGSTLNGVIGRLAPLLGAATFTAFLKGGIDTLDMLGDLSDRTGVAASTLSGFQLVAAQSDTSLEALGKGLNKLSIYMAENGEAAAKLGITAKDPAEAFVQLSNVLADIENPQQRAALANKILGKSYQELLPALLQGGDALRDQIEKGKEYSGVTEESVAQAQAFNDQFDELKIAAGGFGTKLATDLLPTLNEIINAMRNAYTEGGLMKSFFMGMGTLGKNILFGSDYEAKLNRATKAIPNEINELATKLRNDINGSAPLSLIDRKKTELDIQYLAKEANNLKRELGIDQPKPSQNNKGNNGAIESIINPNNRSSKKSLDNQYAKEYAQDVSSLMQAFQQLESPTQSVSEKLQDQLDTYTALDAGVKTYLQGIIDQTKASEDFAVELERTNSMMELTLQYEQAAAAQSKTISDAYDAILQETEDMNIALIKDDKERAEAQLKVEHDRRVSRIAMMEGEQDDIDLLLQAEEDRYLAAQKSIADGANSSKGFMKDLGATFSSAFEDAIAGGEDFSNVLQGLAQDIERMLARRFITDPLMKGLDSLVINPLSDWLGGMVANADGGVYSGAGISAYSGQVVSSPTVFPFAKGIGLMGEAGPEAILPLSRGSDGKLGVSGGGNNVTVNVFEAPGTKANVQQEQGADGSMNIKVVVEQLYGVMNRDISRGTGIAPTLERRYGLNRVSGGI